MVLPNKIKGIKKEDIISNGYYLYGEECGYNDTYIKRVPVWKYNSKTVLTGVIHIILPSGRIVYDVIDDNGQLYAPFYFPAGNKSHYPLLSKVYETLDAEIESLETKPSKKRMIRKTRRK